MFSFFARQCAIVSACFLFVSSVFGQTLTPGDLVIVGYNFKDPDEFSILPLVSLQPGTQFFITDCGWNANTSAFRPGEGVVTYTVPSGGIEAGQQIHYPDDAGFITQGISGFFGLSMAGDQLLIYQGSFASPQFLFGLTDYNGGWIGTSFSPTNQSSHLPPGLKEGESALALDEYLQAQFECVFPFSNREEFLKRLTNPNQWIKSADRVVLPIMGCGFDVLTENSLEWNYHIDNKGLLLFISSLIPVKDVSWWYYKVEGPQALKCQPVSLNKFECKLPEDIPEVLLVKPCQTNINRCEEYKRMDGFQESGIVWNSSAGGCLAINIPEKYVVFAASLHLSDGSLVWRNERIPSKLTEIHHLKPGYYILTIEMAQVMYRVPVSVSE